jgi:Tfp pilus assembly protein PilO
MREVSKRERYFITLCAVCIMCFLGYKFVYLRFAQSYRYNQIRMTTLETKYLSHKNLAAQGISIQRSLTSIRNELKKVESRFFSGDKDSLVAARIQQIIQQICMENGIKIQQSRVLKSQEIGRYRAVNVQAVFQGSITALNRIVFALTNNQKYLSIPELEIRVTNRRKPTTVRATMTVSGIMGV